MPSARIQWHAVPGRLFLPSSVVADGNTMQRAPTWSGNLAVEYETSLSGGSTVALNANYFYTSQIFFDSVEQFSQGSYGLLNLRATWTSPDDRIAVSVFGANVTDEEYLSAVLPVPFGILQNHGPPVTYGDRRR